jgi:hypothetical protein
METENEELIAGALMGLGVGLICGAWYMKRKLLRSINKRQKLVAVALSSVFNKAMNGNLNEEEVKMLLDEEMNFINLIAFNQR